MEQVKKKGYFIGKWVDFWIALAISCGIASMIAGNYIISIIVVFLLFACLILFLTTNNIPLLVKRYTFEKLAFVAFILLCFIYLSSIPKIAFLPFSPKYAMLLITMIFLLIARRKIDWRMIYRSGRPVWFYFVLILFFTALNFDLNKAVPILEGMLFLFFTIVLVGSKIDRAVFLTRFIAFFTLLSAVWFLGNLLFYDTFLSLRQVMYGSYINFEKPLTVAAMGRPTGLTFNHHIMGYHMAASLILVGLLALVERKKIYKTFWILVFPFVVVATILTAQRSVIPAAVTALLIYFTMRDTKKIIYLIAIICLGLVIVGNVSVADLKYSDFKALQSRLDSEEDIYSRLGWQVTALKIIVDNPLGLTFSGKSWDNEAESYGADFSDFRNEPQAVHNSYLGIMLKYGWMGVLVVIAVLRFLIIRIITILKYGQLNIEGAYAAVTAFALIALLLQAMFHNAGVFTNEPVSFMIMSLLIAWMNILHVQENIQLRRIALSFQRN